MVGKREVNEHDVFLLDQHVMNHSDDYRFVGYQSRPKNVVERHADAAEKLRGVPLQAIKEDVAKQHDVINRKKEAIFNIIGENDDDKYHLSNQVVNSYVSKMMDDFAVVDVLGDEVTSMEYDHQFAYYHRNDTDRTYAIFNFNDQTNQATMSHDADDLDDLKDFVSSTYPDIELDTMEQYSPYEFVYLESDEFHGTDAKRAYFRDAFIGEVAELDPDGFHEDNQKFISINTGSSEEALERDGIYAVDDFELYKYTSNMSRAKKISGKGGEWEAEELTRNSGFLNGGRERFLKSFKEELETETGRLNDFDFTDLERSVNEQYVAPKPAYELVEKSNEVEHKDELEL